MAGLSTHRDDDTSRPPLDVSALQAGLPPGFTLEVIPAAPSTNTLLLERLATARPGVLDRHGVLDRLVLVTEHQTAGLGRLGRTWTTPDRAALTLSICLKPVGVPVAAWAWLPLLTGLAVVETVNEMFPGVGLKWPNDVLIEPTPGEAPGSVRPGKLAGILAATSGDAVVVGIGLNVTQTEPELPVSTATSLLLAGAGPVDRTRLLLDLLHRWEGLIEPWQAAGGDVTSSGLASRVARRTLTLGRTVRVELPGTATPLVGRAERLDDDGRLVVTTPDGQTRSVAAGDVHHVRVTQ